MFGLTPLFSNLQIAVVCLFFIDVFYLRLDVFLAISILSRSDVGRNFEV